MRFLGNQRACFRCVVSGEYFEFAAEICTLQNIEKRLDCGKSGRLFPKHKIVTLAVKRNEVQAESLSSRSCCQADVRIPRHNTVCCRQMAPRLTVITQDVTVVDAGLCQKSIQQCTAAGTWFAVGESDSFARQVVDL